MSTKNFPPQIWYTYVQNDPVNFRDLWGLSVNDTADDSTVEERQVQIVDGIAPPVGYTFQEAFNNITSGYGPRDVLETPVGNTSGFHGALDFGFPEGTRVNAVGQGTVTKQSDNHPNYGIYVEIEHPSGKKTLYAHLSMALVTVGENVEAGQKIGEVGSTGMSTGPHLHFGLDGDGDGSYKSGEIDNPLPVFFGSF